MNQFTSFFLLALSCIFVLNCSRNTNSKTKQYENTTGDICEEIKKGTAEYWQKTAVGDRKFGTEKEYFDFLVTQEAKILENLVQSGAQAPTPVSQRNPDVVKDDSLTDLEKKNSGDLPPADPVSLDRIDDYGDKLAKLCGSRTTACNYQQLSESQKTCQFQASAENKDPESGLSSSSVKTLIDTIYNISNVTKMCDFLGDLTKSQVSKNFQTCAAEISKKFCSIPLSTVKSGVNEIINQTPDRGQAAVNLAKPALIGMTDLVVKCVTASLSQSFLDAAKKAASSSADDILKNRSTLSKLGVSIATEACRGAGKIIGDTIDRSQEVKEGLNSCRFSGDKSVVASCFRTASTICGVLADSGRIDVSSFLPDSENALINLSKDLASSVASGACKLGSAATQSTCALISAAANQIKTAIVTGNNDWAHCTGFDQLGQCIGNKVIGPLVTGVTEESLRSSAATPENGYTLCCKCDRTLYSRYNYSRDRVYRIDHTFRTTVKDGGVYCKSLERNTYDVDFQDAEGYPIYYRYESCMERYVVGNACPFPQSIRPKDESIVVQYYEGATSIQSIGVP